MQTSRSFPLMWICFAAVLVSIVFGNVASGSSVREKAYAFNGTDGVGYRAGLRLDVAGNLWGISLFGGAYGYGEVFAMTRDIKGHLAETVLYSFANGNDGGNPADDDGPSIDGAGNLYGTTSVGGIYQGGTVFKLTPLSTGWQESVLWNFTCGNDGCEPEGGVVSDALGNLFGTTFAGGPGGAGYGTVFELSLGANGQWTESTLHVFTGGRDGAGPYATLVLDRFGNLYGTTYGGGSHFCHGTYFGCGTVFELKHTSAGWNEQVLYNFTGSADGDHPFDRVVFDPSGNLYGTAGGGGDPSCACGSVFRLTPPTSSGAQWGLSVLHTFTGGNDGAFPTEGLVPDKSGNVYGTASAGGIGSCISAGCGTAFRLVSDHNGGWNFELLYSFSGKGDGGQPYGVLLSGPFTLVGTTGQGGYFGGDCASGNGCGTVFELAVPLAAK